MLHDRHSLERAAQAAEKKGGEKGRFGASVFRRRYFEGYATREVLGRNGRPVLRQVYVGVWYVQELTQKERLRHRILVVVLALLAGALLAFGATREIAANMRALCALPEFVCVFGLVWTLYGLVNDCLSEPKRTVGDYRSSSGAIRTGSLMAAVAGAAACLATLVYAAIEGGNTGLFVLAAAAELAAGALAFLIWRLESKVKYTKQQADPDDGKSEEEEYDEDDEDSAVDEEES